MKKLFYIIVGIIIPIAVIYAAPAKRSSCEFRMPKQCKVNRLTLTMTCNTNYVKLKHENVASHYFFSGTIPGKMSLVYWDKNYIELNCEHR